MRNKRNKQKEKAEHFEQFAATINLKRDRVTDLGESVTLNLYGKLSQMAGVLCYIEHVYGKLSQMAGV